MKKCVMYHFIQYIKQTLCADIQMFNFMIHLDVSTYCFHICVNLVNSVVAGLLISGVFPSNSNKTIFGNQ